MPRGEREDEHHATQSRKRRIPFAGRVLVDAKDGVGPSSEQIHDLSMGGLFIECMLPLPPGKVVDLTLPLHPYKLRTTARVVWTRPRENGESRPCGMAVEFLSLTEAQKKLLYLEVGNYVKHGGALLVGTPGVPAGESAGAHTKGEVTSRLTQTQIWLIIGLAATLAIVAVIVAVSVL